MNIMNNSLYQVLFFLNLPFFGHLKNDNTTEKIIVYSGWPFENGAYAEIIDLSNSQSVSQVFARIPMLTEVELSFGGKVSNDYIYCGGWDGNDYVKECYKVGEKTPFLELLHPRSSGAGVILPNDTLFITGGKVGSSGTSTKSTELVTLHPPVVSKGPTLLDNFERHCSVLVNDQVFLIGGVETESKVLSMKLNDSNMSYKSELKQGRWNLACAKMVGSNMVPWIVVTGGRIGWNSLTKTTEIYCTKHNAWKFGPDLPDNCEHGSMITSPSGDGVILLGCFENREAIYKMALNSNGDFQWTKMKQKLKYPRSWKPLISYL